MEVMKVLVLMIRSKALRELVDVRAGWCYKLNSKSKVTVRNAGNLYSKIVP